MGNQLAPAEWPVVGVHAGLSARFAVAVVLVDARTSWITGEDGWAEAGLVLAVVASLPRRASPLLCLAPVLLASAALGVLGAPGYRAHPISPASGHGRLRCVLCPALGVVSVKRMDLPLGIVVVGVVLMIGCRIIVWWPGVIIGAALILGVLVTAAHRRLTR